MELSDECVHFSDFHHDQPGQRRGKHEKLKPEYDFRIANLSQRRWSPPITYILLGLSLLLSALILIITSIWLSQLFSEMKKSNVDFGMKLSQLNNSVTGISERINSTRTNLQTEVTQLKELLGLTKKIRLLNEFQATISQLKQAMPHLQCPVQWTPFKQKLYYFSSHKSTWKEAQKFCQLMDADLAVINSAEEQMYIRWNIYHDHWIGLNDIDEERKWQWVDGTDYDSNFKSWRKGQPDLESIEDEDCVVNSGQGGWDDWPCTSIHFSICEKSA